MQCSAGGLVAYALLKFSTPGRSNAEADGKSHNRKCGWHIVFNANCSVNRGPVRRVYDFGRRAGSMAGKDEASAQQQRGRAERADRRRSDPGRRDDAVARGARRAAGAGHGVRLERHRRPPVRGHGRCRTPENAAAAMQADAEACIEEMGGRSRADAHADKMTAFVSRSRQHPQRGTKRADRGRAAFGSYCTERRSHSFVSNSLPSASQWPSGEMATLVTGYISRS